MYFGNIIYFPWEPKGRYASRQKGGWCLWLHMVIYSLLLSCFAQLLLLSDAKKLPSGSWHCQVYDYTDASGKRHYESFTARTRKEAELLAAEYVVSKDTKILLDKISESELEIAVLVAALGTLRRGEICALTDKDIHGNNIVVNKAYVRNERNEWVLKGLSSRLIQTHFLGGCAL